MAILVLLLLLVTSHMHTCIHEQKAATTELRITTVKLETELKLFSEVVKGVSADLKNAQAMMRLYAPRQD